MAVEPSRPRRWAAMFVASGFCGVAYQVLLSRYVQLIVGGTAYAVSALLVAFMLGSAIGSAVGGAWADRLRRPLRLYAWAEAAIGAYCLAFPWLLPGFERLYAVWAPEPGASLAARNGVRFAVGVLAFVVPSIFMGLTTPAFARALIGQRADMGAWLTKLYGWNTVGAALGALSAAYVLVPVLGLDGSMAVLSVVNFAVCLVALRLAEVVDTSDEATHERERWGRELAVFAAVAFSTGAISFALEVIWTHLLAILLGNSVYAFGLMLGSLLLGLALGSLLARRVAERVPAADVVGPILALAGVAVLATLGIWDDVPAVFLVMARASPTFATMELMRFVVALGLMLLPTTLFGSVFPLVLSAVARRRGLGARLGLVYALNTVGAVLGAIGSSYVLLPVLGSLAALRGLGSALMVVGAAATLACSAQASRRQQAMLLVVLAVLGALLPVRWDFSSLSTMASVYLGESATEDGRLLFMREHPTGGLTTVVERNGVRTLLTNGKFQGDSSEEVPIQHRLAHLPMLFTAERERALVIGLGTGVTLAAVAAHGFGEVVCAELNTEVVAAARQHFADVNGEVLSRPGVRLIEEDGRSILAESAARYDVISIEVNSLWFAGAGAIYSQEFYRLAASRLRRSGVMLQWFPIHHLSSRNVFLVVNTVRSVFPHVSVWTHRHQAFVVASNEPLEVDLASVRGDLARPETSFYLRELESGSPLELLADLVVTDRDVDRFLDAYAALLHTDRSLVSTDAWPTIEYETPKDVLDNFSYFENRATFRRFRSHQSFPYRGTPEPAEALLADAAFAVGWSDPRSWSLLDSLSSGAPRHSAAAARWLIDELTGDDFVGSGESAVREGLSARDVVRGSPLLRVSAESECRPWGGAYARPERLPLSVERHNGVMLEGTRPEYAIDEVLAPQLGSGWRVRPDGRLPSIDLALASPGPVGRLELVASSLDGDAVRVRVLGRDTDGRWHPLATGSAQRDTRCKSLRVISLSEPAPVLSAVRLEMQGAARSHRIALFEVSAYAPAEVPGDR